MNWISVNDKLPEFGQEVIVYSEWGVEGGLTFSELGFEYNDFSLAKNVTHWMSLPQKPSKDKTIYLGIN